MGGEQMERPVLVMGTTASLVEGGRRGILALYSIQKNLRTADFPPWGFCEPFVEDGDLTEYAEIIACESRGFWPNIEKACGDDDAAGKKPKVGEAGVDA